ncbi:hypothetical protein, partial [Solibacillus kalamii]
MGFWCEMFAYVAVYGIWFGVLLEELHPILEDCTVILEHLVFRQYFGQTLRDFFATALRLLCFSSLHAQT